MKAILVNEIQNFERGGDPLDNLNIGEVEKRRIDKILKISESTNIMSKESNGLFCVYDWEDSTTSMRYFQNTNRVLEFYIKLVKDVLEEKEQDLYEIRRNIVVYKIDPNKEGIFYEERDPEGKDGITILFGISFSRDKIYYY
jgi:hypothetical protein